MKSLQFKFLGQNDVYDGRQLRPHYILSTAKLQGSSIIAWIAGCDVKTSELVDWEDKLNEDHIKSAKMIHFLGEFFEMSIGEAVTLQRLWMSIIRDQIEKESQSHLTREGDDLFFNDSKLSVSIVTASPVSKLLHIGINIDASGAPVKAQGLKDLPKLERYSDSEFQELALRILKSFETEWNGVQWACVKVKPVL